MAKVTVKIRAIAKSDVPAVARLLAKGFPHETHSLDQWERSVDWICFPTEFGDDIPRGLVAVGEQGIVAHIGLTVCRPR